LKLPKSAKIIDIGGGESKLVDFLLDEGYQNITVLDISANAIERAKNRLGKKAENVQWIVSDILDFKPTETYDCWHDRATFHFLTDESDIKKHVDLVSKSVNKFLVIGTFATDGPLKCSGLDISQYNESSMDEKFSVYFKQMPCIRQEHITPFNTKQNFIFCSFEKI
jgi:trans-aconitate methyltransferase